MKFRKKKICAKLLIKLFILICDYNIGKSTVFADTVSIQLPKCEACERLVDSFLNGIERTEKYNYEGGNTDWEERKLGLYSNSEVRFVEIQENLCKENKTTMDQCQILAEELEEYLEEWWVKHRWEEPDLRYYLCVTKIQYCLPKWPSSSSRSSASVLKTPIPDGNKCPEGWHFQSTGTGSCVDVNECLTYPCDDDEYCLNTQGSFLCHECHSNCHQCYGPGAYDCNIYNSFIHFVVACWLNFYKLSMVGPNVIFGIIIILLSTNLMFKLPLIPNLFLLCVLLLGWVKTFYHYDPSGNSTQIAVDDE